MDRFASNDSPEFVSVVTMVLIFSNRLLCGEIL